MSVRDPVSPPRIRLEHPGLPAPPGSGSPPLLYEGQRLTQPEFHRRYEAMPDVRAELIGGRVYMASPMKSPHGLACGELYIVIRFYSLRTPGTMPGNGSTVILGPAGEPEPDVHLRLLPECGGASRITPEQYLEGPPDLVVEVADTTAGKDLDPKRRDYADHGVREYLVLLLAEHRLRAFDLATGRARRVGSDGVYRSRVFPGLWLDPAAILAADTARSLEVLEQGLAAPEHAAFVEDLASRRRSASRTKSPRRRRGT